MRWVSVAASGPVAVVQAVFHPWTLPLSVFPGREIDQDHGGAVSRWYMLHTQGQCIWAMQGCMWWVLSTALSLPSRRPLFLPAACVSVGDGFSSALPRLALSCLFQDCVPPLHRRGRTSLPPVTGWSEGPDICPLVSMQGNSEELYSSGEPCRVTWDCCWNFITVHLLPLPSPASLRLLFLRAIPWNMHLRVCFLGHPTWDRRLLQF